MAALLGRNEFRLRVLTHSNGLCVFCGRPAVDAHHVLERKLWPDGGYYLANGAAVCEACHWDSETTKRSVEDIRAAAGIDEILLPPVFSPDTCYDKWATGSAATDCNAPARCFRTRAPVVHWPEAKLGLFVPEETES